MPEADDSVPPDRKLEYLKRQLDELAGENFRMEYTISSLRLDLQKKRAGFALLVHLQQLIGTHPDLDGFYQSVMEGINATLVMDRTVIFASTGRKNHFRVSHWLGFKEPEGAKLAASTIVFPPGFADEGNVLLVNKGAAPTPLSETLRRMLDLPYFICLPVLAEGRPPGLLLSGRCKEAWPIYPPLNQADVDTLTAIVGHISASVRSERIRVLEEIDRFKTRFFANVSHEFRTPLTLTLGPLEDLRDGRHGPLPESAARQVQLAHRNASRVLDLVNQILELARLESGRLSLETERFDLAAFLRDVSRQFISAAERRSISFSVQLPEEPLCIHADPRRLGSVFSNLLSNALKFTPKGGAVRIGLAADAETARITVRDSGPGIPAHILPHLFERFSPIEASSDWAHPGVGIGLSLVRELVELHGGAVRVESDWGFGSTFTVELPVETARLQPGLSSDKGSDATFALPEVALPSPDDPIWDDDPADDDRTTVLVVEDNADVRLHIRGHLSDVYRIIEAANGEQGLQKARECVPDLVVADVMMPGMDGLTLCRRLKGDRQTDFIPVILLTARAGRQDRLEGLHTEADAYLTKPIDMAELKVRIKNLIRLRQRLRDRVQQTPEREQLSDLLHPAEVDAASTAEELVKRIRGVIEANLGDESFTVERLADEVGLSRGHLHRRLRILLGEAPSDAIRRMRLERAAQLLAAQAGTVSEVAYAVGFKSVAHFSNTFDRHYGCRPSAFAA